MFPWFKKKSSANTAKDRLTIAIMSDRDNSVYPFMDQMKAEIIEVVKKYIGVKTIDIKKEVDGDVEALSIDVQLDKN
ncbi:MAG: cell division topological specificity factor MinE [Campylobacterota bacterium]|nr:cell division topological specificity factor MinE [Campylobacterota bacterium]